MTIKQKIAHWIDTNAIAFAIEEALVAASVAKTEKNFREVWLCFLPELWNELEEVTKRIRKIKTSKVKPKAY